jgi:cytochrome c biogenesis protein CcmG/thiol:disulfide interchange protein DsbE
VQRARPRHDSRRVIAATTERARAAAAAAVLAVLGLAGCGGGGETPGGAADLPGPVPQGTDFRDPPANALSAPPFSAELLDGTRVRAADLWRDRPLVLVFTASWCESCKRVHRTVARVAHRRGDAVALLGIVPADDAEAARDYASELDLGYPIAVAGERVWLHYAAREPPVVVLVSRGGKVLRGWPGGVEAGELSRRLGELFAP